MPQRANASIWGLNPNYLKLRLYFSTGRPDYCLVHCSNSTLPELPLKILARFMPWPSMLLPRRPPATPIQSAPPAAPARPAQLPPDEAVAVTERRASTLRTMFPLLFSRHARRADLWQAIVIERYLSQAANLADLEQRIEEVQRRRQFSWSE
jgi:hypothetical protein